MNKSFCILLSISGRFLPFFASFCHIVPLLPPCGRKWQKFTKSQNLSSLDTRAPLSTFSAPPRTFNYANIDLVVALPSSQGFTYLLTMGDRFIRWPKAVPINGTDAKKCATAFISHWVAHFGLPVDMTSDRGAQFTNVFPMSISSRFLPPSGKKWQKFTKSQYLPSLVQKDLNLKQ